MACRYYDDLIIKKLQKWIPEASNLRVLKPDETKRLFELTADDKKDSPLNLPLIAVSRDTDIELLSTVKSPKSYDGIRVSSPKAQLNTSALFNVIPIKLNYKLDIYTKTAEEGDEYLRSFLFKLINNPTIKIVIPYNDFNIEHIANIRVLSTVSDTSSIAERLFSGQFTRWTIQLEIHDAFLFSIPYKQNWVLITDSDEIKIKSNLEISRSINTVGTLEPIDVAIIKK
jgi:hypothetical protein